MTFQEYDISNSPNPGEISRGSLINEAQSVVQPARLLSQYRTLTKTKVGSGQRIILFPGLKTNVTTMFPLRNYLAKLGYAPEGWGLGINHGQVESYRDQMIEKLTREHDQSPITLIGWSLGGSVAREIARSMPDRVKSVITFGTPAVGGPKFTIGDQFWDKAETQRIYQLIEALDKSDPIQVPMSIIFTKKDSFVAWPACLDRTSKQVKHYEVFSTHLSLGIDPSVWEIIAYHLRNHADKSPQTSQME